MHDLTDKKVLVQLPAGLNPNFVRLHSRFPTSAYRSEERRVGNARALRGFRHQEIGARPH